ncbi:fibronectin type III domain-containing protein, partial [bacterium]|nr:fibronectin type III domain-containing protein [bacterium]
NEHHIRLENLKSSTEYEIRIKVVDQSGNPNEISTDQMGNILLITTKAAADNEPPIVEAVRVEGKTDNSVKIVWFTKEPATSIVEYGLSTTYENEPVKIDIPPAPLKNDHVVTLSNLSSSTTYHFRVISSDGSGNQSIPSEDFVFQTMDAPDTQKPLFTSKPMIVQGFTTLNSVTVNFKTNEFSDTRVFYKKTADAQAAWKEVVDYGMTAPGELHKATITGLEGNIEYDWYAATKDESKNEQVFNPDPSTFKTSEPKQTIKLNVTSNGRLSVTGITQTSAFVSWKTNKYASTYISYRVSTESKWINKLGDAGNEHNIILTGLSSGTQYTIKAQSIDEVSGESISLGPITFGTLSEEDKKAPEITSPPFVSKTTQTTATIQWDTDELSNTFIKFRKETDGDVEGLQGKDEYVTKHGFTLYDLEPDTKYNFTVISSDISPNKNTVEKSGQPFTTLKTKDTAPPKLVSGHAP